MKQSHTMSLVEAVANVIVGYMLAIATQIVVFPLFGIETDLAEHLTIGLAFVGVSLLRGYLLRRLFEAVTRSGRFGCTEPLLPRFTRFPPGVAHSRER
jgi:hypothetical protein